MEPALRPVSACPPDCTENWSIASMGSSVPAMPETPPWFTAAVFWNASLLSAPSIWKLLPRVRTPFTECLRHAGRELQHPPEVAAVERQFLHLLGPDDVGERGRHGVESGTGGRHFDHLGSSETPILKSTDETFETGTSTVTRWGWKPSSAASTV